jgi:hypothetical protein
MTPDPLVVAVLGLGEAGSEIAAGLCAEIPRIAGASEQWLRQLAQEQAAAGAQRSSASSSP